MPAVAARHTSVMPFWARTSPPKSWWRPRERARASTWRCSMCTPNNSRQSSLPSRKRTHSAPKSQSSQSIRFTAFRATSLTVRAAGRRIRLQRRTNQATAYLRAGTGTGVWSAPGRGLAGSVGLAFIGAGGSLDQGARSGRCGRLVQSTGRARQPDFRVRLIGCPSRSGFAGGVPTTVFTWKLIFSGRYYAIASARCNRDLSLPPPTGSSHLADQFKRAEVVPGIKAACRTDPGGNAA